MDSGSALVREGGSWSAAFFLPCPKREERKKERKKESEKERRKRWSNMRGREGLAILAHGHVRELRRPEGRGESESRRA